MAKRPASQRSIGNVTVTTTKDKPTTPPKAMLAELKSALVALKAVRRFLKRLHASAAVLAAVDAAIDSLSAELKKKK